VNFRETDPKKAGLQNRYADLKSYDLYDRGYKSGSQINIFFGPLWIEEAIAITKQSESGDSPVYGYSDIYYNELMLGHYIVNGTIAIAYTEPNYLLKIMNEVQNFSIQDDELYELIERRKSIFQNTVKYKLLTEKLLHNQDIATINSYATDYTTRIMSEIELAGMQNGKPYTFEMTIVRGNLHDKNASVDIYQDVKIVGQVDNIVNDDSAQIELYPFIAKRKPEIKKKYQITKPEGTISKHDIVDMMLDVGAKLVNRLVEGPKVTVSFPTTRTVHLTDTNRVAYSGIITNKIRMYGRPMSAMEIVWEYEFDKYINEYTKLPTNKPDTSISSDVQLYTYEVPTDDDDSVESEDDYRVKTPTNLYMKPPKVQSESTKQDPYGFSNSFGKIAYIDKSATARMIAAICNVRPLDNKTRRQGGTVLLPRYNISELHAGSLYTPRLIDLEVFRYNNTDIANVTAATLWWQPLGFRESSIDDNSKYTEMATEEDEQNESQLTSITNPLFSLAIFDSDAYKYIDENTMGITLPFLIDTYLTPADKIGNKKTPYTKNRPMVLFNTKGEPNTLELPTDTDNTWENIIAPANESVFMVEHEQPLGIFKYGHVHTVHSIIDSYSLDESGTPKNESEIYRPFPFTFKPDLTNFKYLRSSLSKSLHIRPWVFFHNKPVTLTKNLLGSGWSISYSSISEPTYSNKIDELLYMMNKYTEASCDLPDFRYDWGVVTNNTEDLTNSYFEVLGLYTPVMTTETPMKLIVHDGSTSSGEPNIIECKVENNNIYYNDNVISIDSLSITNPGEELRKVIQLKVYWSLALVPVGTPDKKTDSRSYEDIELAYNLEERTARLVQIYNIVRCNIYQIPRNAWEDIFEDNIIKSLLDRFDRWLKSLTTLDVSIEYKPIDKMLDRISAFSRGYVFTIKAAEIAEQLLQCIVTSIPGKNDNDKINTKYDGKTAEELLTEAKGSVVSVRQELLTEILHMIKNDAKSNNIKIIEEGPDYITLYNEVQVPPPSIVNYSLSEDGYEDMKQLNNFIDTTDSTQYESIFGGYNE
jgi:hypothetical protein